jgi:membrane-associated phospholipid phosphatase
MKILNGCSYGRSALYRRTIFLLVFFIFSLELYGQKNDSAIVPVSNIFHNIGKNTLNAVTYNYGMNFIGAAAETYVFIETGWDWEWRMITFRNDWLAGCGSPGLYIGYVVPAAAPVIAYITGRFLENQKLQITGLALAQSVLLTLGIQASMKMVTGRTLPGIVTDLDHRRSSHTDDFSGNFDWFNMNPIGGWPSSHAANAFAAAAAVTEIYADSLALKILLYSYAVLIGFDITLNVHWASEAVAGALIGYAVGKTVGRSFKRLYTKKKNAVSFYASPVSIGVRITV